MHGDACSGAGKSTLLDTLAMQLPEGTITGAMTINGQTMTRTAFRSISTYVPQVCDFLGFPANIG